jgi:hypothetical protein
VRGHDPEIELGIYSIRTQLRLSSGGVAEWTNAVVLKLAAFDVSASDRTCCTLQTAAPSRWGPV